MSIRRFILAGAMIVVASARIALASCSSDAGCTNPGFPNCGPDGNCWSGPCDTLCDNTCCGGDYPYCYSDGTCHSQPDGGGGGSCTSDSECTNPGFPNCGPDGNCWSG